MPAPASKRILWKGAIAFGLVHIPIALHSATQNQSIDFDWLDRRSMEPVGYKRINKVTGEEIDREDIVKGVEYEDGEYVVVEPDEIAAAYPRTTQTVEIEAFVPLDDIPFVYLERPYYVAPINKGAKVYALLREVLAESRLAGLAKVVIQTKQHLALLFSCGPVLILNLLRWGDEVRDWSALNLPEKDSKALGLSQKELTMARQLIKDMTVEWEPEHYTDSFREQVMQLIQDKVEAGETTTVSQPESEEEPTGSARIYDLTEMLQRSLKGRQNSGAKKGTTQGSKTDDTDEEEDASATSKRNTKTSRAKKSNASKVEGSSSATSKTGKRSAASKKVSKTASKTVKSATKSARTAKRTAKKTTKTASSGKGSTPSGKAARKKAA